MVRAVIKESLSLASPRVFRFYLNFFLSAVALTILCVIIARLGLYKYLIIAILLSYSILFLNFSLIGGAYQHLSILGIIMLFAGIFLLIFLPPFMLQVLAAGGIIGSFMLLAGLLKVKQKE